MSSESIKKLTNDVFNVTENTVYEVIESFRDEQKVDKSLTYTFIKAFYLHALKLYMNCKNKKNNFDEIYVEYKESLKEYYMKNNSQITEEILNDLMESFDKCFEMIETIRFTDVESDYEFRHHIIDSFEIFKMILRKKSKEPIRQDLFENYISKFKRESEMIFEIYRNNS